jgi:hypothetical protein
MQKCGGGEERTQKEATHDKVNGRSDIEEHGQVQSKTTLLHAPGVGLLGSYVHGLTDTLTPEALSLAVPHEAAHDPSGKMTPGRSAWVVAAVAREVEAEAARIAKYFIVMVYDTVYSIIQSK